MVTEKLSKAYYWRLGSAPRKSHAAFVKFLKSFGLRDSQERERIARLLSFNSYVQFQSWLRANLTLAFEIQQLAPNLAGENGPNPEYPWPVATPQHAPCEFYFLIVEKLTTTGRGRRFMQIIGIALREFPKYA